MIDQWLQDFLSQHLLIESLGLHSCNMLKMIKISSDRIKSLPFHHCLELIEVDIVTPNLQKLEYYGGVNIVSGVN